jgi:hypothetical protein
MQGEFAMSGHGRFFLFAITLFFVINIRPVRAQSLQPVQEAVMTVTGDPEIVFDWTTDRCEDLDIPDLAARAFRDSNGNVQLLATHYVGRREIGPSLDGVQHDCSVIAYSVDDADPSLFSDHEWLASLYTEDGNTIYALQHNEYQGHIHAGQCVSGRYFDCWYNTITLAVSTDGGRSFGNVTTPPGHLVASLPYPYEDGAGPYGYMTPSNMIVGEDGFIYAYIKGDAYRGDRQWVCLMRTDDISDPASWRAWDGEGFNFAFPNPYVDDVSDPRSQLCEPIELGLLFESITYNTYLDQYVMIGSSADTYNGREVWGVYYSFSADLINWTHRQLLMEVEFTSSYAAGDPDPIAYPSLLDPDSESMIFQTSDQQAYLYYTQFHYQNGQQTLDRDLVRVPVEFNLATVDAPEYQLTLSGIVPADATGALVGYRINMECECNGTAEFLLYETRYQEGDDPANLIPNGGFNSNLGGWSTWGDGPYELLPSDISAGSMLAVSATEGQSAGLNGTVFPVTAGEAYTLTFVAKVGSETTDAGYFTIMWMDGAREFRRETIPLTPNE